jgi:hypothetical protein
MVVYPYLLNNGFLLYKDIINPYPPTLPITLSAFTRLFGYEQQDFHLLTMAIILVSDSILYFITLKVQKNHYHATFAVLFFAILSIPFSVNGLWFDLVQLPFILLAIFFFIKYLESKKTAAVIFSFIFLIFVFYIKQQVLWLIAVLAAYVIFLEHKKIIKISKIFSITSAVFFLCLIIQIFLFDKKNILSDYFFWVFRFPFVEASKMPGYILLPTIKQLAIVLSLFTLFIPTILFGSKSHKYILLLGAATLLFAYPRFDYFHLVPALSIISIVAVPNFLSLVNARIPVKIAVLIALFSISIFSFRYFKLNYGTETRFFETDIIVSAKFLKIITQNNNVVYVQNGPDQLYPLSNTLPPKPWADEFPWYLELPGIQERILEGVQREPPGFVIYKPYDQGKLFGLGVYKPKKIDDYLSSNYEEYFKLSNTLWLKKAN